MNNRNGDLKKICSKMAAPQGFDELQARSLPGRETLPLIYTNS